MNLKINLLTTALIAGLHCGYPASAQDAPTPPAALHTVQPKDFSVPKADVTAKLLPTGDLSVASADLKAPLLIDLGWMTVQPRTTYRARYRLRAEALQSPANVSVMLREHETKTAKPFTPYNREGAGNREVKPEQAGNWLERQLSFTTGEKTQVLSGAIIVAQLKGEIQLGTFELLDGAKPAPPAATQANTPTAEQSRAAAEAEFEQAMIQIRAQANARVPLTPRPLVFSRAQMKYGLEMNYYHQWNDRPLFVNRDYRVPSPYVMPLPSYKRMAEEVAQYDIDGFAFFPETKGRMNLFEMQEQSGVAGVGILPEFLGEFTPDHLNVKTEVLQRALKSPHTPKIGGKVLITSYGAEALSPAQWKQILTTLRERVGDRFLFLPTLTNVASLQTTFTGKVVSRAAIEKEKAFLRSYLEVCDGIYFNYPPSLRNKDRTFNGDFYRDVFIPVFKSVLSEPAYRNKYLGLSAYKAHLSPERGNNFLEDGTRTLRRSFEAAMEARPDVIILPEWDEENENTSFRPTVYNGRTSQRILRYYMSQIKRKAPTPLPNDDVSLPNLILSTRKNVTLGENFLIELLNVPDSPSPGGYSVELALQNESGQIVHKFAPVTFDTARLQEHRFNLATETIANTRTLIPVFTVRGYKGQNLVCDSGFHPVQLRATWNWDDLDVQQPLRDLLRTATTNLAWQAPTGATSPLTLTASVASPTEIALVELLGDDDEVYAFDAKDEFFRNDSSRELFLVEYRSQNHLEMEGSLTLKNAAAQWLTNETPPRQAQLDGEKNNRIPLKTAVSVHQRWIYLAIPKSSLNAAELDFDFDFDKARFSVPLREVLAQKMIARGFANGLHISIQPYRRQIDMPVHLNQKEVSFRVPVWPEIATEQFHLRLTGKDGRIFRSRPLLLPSTNRGNATELRIYSDTQKRGVDVSVTSDRIPQLVYDFAPQRGAVLLTDAGRPFWATLGGFSNTTTGRGTINGLFRKYPKGVERSAPSWVVDEGSPALEFDGKGTYLELPREALPRHGAFTFGFEIKPATGKDQFLLVNRTVSAQNGLILEIRDGKLQASFRDADAKANVFPTNLAVPANRWSTVQLRYDFEKLTLTVNGQSKSFPLSLPAFNIGFTVVGEGWTGNWYEGRLRKLRILHNAQ